MNDISMTTTGILEHMRNGAKLFRRFDEIQLALSDGRRFEVPEHIFDGLMDEHKIVAELGGFYRLA
jgi:hypothetical protein